MLGHKYYSCTHLNICEKALALKEKEEQEEAEKEVERRKFETLLLKYGGRRWFNEKGDNFYLVRENKDFETYQAYCILPLGTIYFDTEEQAKKAISEIGEERLKRALFEVR
jgi:hypothetical protein